ncbi:MAG: hypothetical protein JNJ90_00145 [Saprospiraceae bacterium]|nr:hypothetical protein [Saprospiraceae bacterium]
MAKSSFFFLCFFAGQILYAQSWFTTGQNADLMLSGVDFNNTGGANRFNHPNGLASDGTRLLVCDRFNNRILVWNALPTAWDTPPDLVLGQPDFTSNNPGTGKHQLNWAGNASLATTGKLAVADTENDRILLWQTFPTSNGQQADVALNLGNLSPAGNPLTYGWPWGVWTDGTRLAVVATTGSAILFWNSFPTVDDAKPDYVVKLPQFGTPRNISTDGSTYFFVGDHNAKVNGTPGTFFWNAYPTAANQPYDFYRDEWIKGVKLPGEKLVAGGLSSIYLWDNLPTTAGHAPNLVLKPPMYKNGDGVDVLWAGGRLFVNNYNGNNVLVFNGLPDNAGQLPDFALGSPTIYAQTLDSIHYIQNPVLASDGTRLVATSDFDRTIHIWNTIPIHSGQKSDQQIKVSPGVDIWANAVHGSTMVVAGRKAVSVWTDLSQISATPSFQFINNIGTATFTDLRGVALDAQFFYLADNNGKIYGWKGMPVSAATNPDFVIDNPGTQYGFLHSNGEYLCATKPEPPAAVYIYRVTDLAAGNTTPFKTIGNNMAFQMNQPSQAMIFGQSLAIACRGGHSVYLFDNLADAGSLNHVVTLGQPFATSHEAGIGINRLFMPASLLYLDNSIWVGEFKFSSRILKFSPGSTTDVSNIDANAPTVLVYPNPIAGDAFTLYFEATHDGVFTLDLFDSKGRLLKFLDAPSLHAGDNYRNRFPLTDTLLPKGILLVRIVSPSGQVWAKVVR